MDQQTNEQQSPIYQRTVAEHGDPREVVNEIEQTIAQARASRVVVLS